MATTDITAKYSPSMSWFYDRFVADAVHESVSPLLTRAVPTLARPHRFSKSVPGADNSLSIS